MVMLIDYKGLETVPRLRSMYNTKEA